MVPVTGLQVEVLQKQARRNPFPADTLDGQIPLRVQPVERKKQHQ